jgi:opacity protein-like surface antigen
MPRLFPLALVLVSAVVLVSAGVSPASAKGAPGYPYVGAGLGVSFIDTEIQDVSSSDLKIDGNDFAYKFLAGYRWRLLGVEGDYRNLGEVQGEGAADSLSVSPTSWDVFGMVYFTVAMVDIFGKVGVSFNSIDTVVDDVNETEFAWGLGAGLSLGRFGVRAEYESLGNSGPESLSMLSASALLNFK